MQFKALALAALPAFVSAATFNVTVGGTGFTFTPNTVTAAVGDTIVFDVKGNHSVTQVPFANPCTSTASGFDSGFVNVANPVNGDTTVTLTINDTNPIWLKCAQEVGGNHCSFGMVAAINPPTTGSNTFQSFMNSAMASGCTTSTTSSSSSGGGYGYGYFACTTPTTPSGDASMTKVGSFGLLSAALFAASMLL
ncbi:hypothetical protein EXIGLDRAFT_835285 [Exidia glandulosa HHB12029]|uniref:Cupredoxin n=1 Tax=Exidia glandulosa HHB12029 TaxID=1314781 RepID=A0A165IZ43_EXIGL|nr:hypothetical protein EXIGLDRAFT_835285 [Exidia glandulosa HHB12029]